MRPSPPYGKTALKIIGITCVAVLLLINLFTQVFMVVRYYGNGMEPTLTDRQMLILRKTEKVSQGDIIAFYYNNKVLVRRVICEGGSTVSVSDSGAVTVNDRLLEESYVEKPSIGQTSVQFPFHVPIGQYFVMGDNRTIAMDSRLAEIGTVPQDRIIGKVLGVA